MDGKDLAAAVKPPAKFKRKTVYFIKNQKTSLNAENIKKNVTYGDFAESPLETLSALSQEVILPVLSNPMNRSGWPDVVSKEVTENLHKFIANGEPNTYPGPLTEVDFWTERAANLNSIHQQLSTERVKKVAKVLELVKSTYYPAFNRLLKDVNTACLEANDTVKYLKPLRKYLEKMNSMDDFTALIELFKPMFHTMLLIWKHSGYYNTSAKMVTLIREMCNDLIMQACKFVPGPELMQMEPQEAVDKLRQTVRVLSAFKSYYFDNKARTLEETPNNPWKFQNSALFGRLDTFLDRCNDVLNLSQTALQFHKLERVEVGGTKGKTLTNSVKQIFTDFQTAAEKFQKLNYDAMNVDATQFADDFAIFCGVIRELERRLGAVIAQAFDDCTTVASIFKLLDSFEGLLDRGVIAADLERKHLDLVSGYGQDLKEVADMFRETKEDPPLNKNAAPHSGRVTWVRGLKERVAGPMEKLHSLPKLVLDSEEARSVQQQYDHLIVEMDQFEKATVEDWCNLISAISDQKLKQPLMSQDPQGNVLRVNFDPALVRLLRETRYFLLLPELPIEIPANALKIYERDVMFGQQVGNLQLIVGIYNNVQATILPVEKPLITQKLEAVDAALKKGLQTLNWNSHHIDDYIMEVMALVRDVNETLATVKGNVKRTSEVLAGWVANPMFDRKEGKVHTYEELTNSFRDVSSKCHSLISDGGKEITKLLSSSNRTLKVSKGAPAWKAYVDYIGDIVIDGLVECIIASVHRLTSQVDPENMAKHEIAPLLEIQLELIVPDIVWIPELGSGGAPGVRDMFSKWFKSFLEIATLIKRLDTGEGNYAKELEEDYTVYDAISEVQGILGANEIKCNALKAQYSKYGYLWKRDLNETLKEFLVAEGKQLEDGTRDDPTLDRFEAEIAKYRAVQEEIQALPTSATIGYIKIDAKPIKQALTTWVTKWIYLFTHYLQIKVVSSMEELYKFMNQSNATLDLKVGSELATEPLPEGEAVEGADSEALKAAQAEENRKSLYSIMSCMRDVRKRSDKTDNMFEPLRDTVSLLTKFSITMTDVVLKQLEEGPLAWKSLKKKMFQRREILAPLQQAEAIDIRRKSDSFGEKVEDFRKFFQQKAPFSVPGAELKLEHVRPAYLVLDAFHHGQVESRMSVTKIMADSEYLRECQDLFELYVSDYIMLTRCKLELNVLTEKAIVQEELGYLKALWDMVGAVMFTFTDWLLEERLKAMLTSLPLVSDLHHPAMRERHWKQLMKATGKNFIMDSKFNLGNLLELGLHNYVDACSEIVDRAQKELIIEKALKKIDETWSSLSLTFSPYQDTDNVQMTVEDSITEALETDNLALQTMSGGKYVQGNPKFLEIVTNWQKKLGTVDVVLNTWLDVQKKWQALESIFVGSADIRVQLPEDSKRFDVDLMKSAPDTPNVVEACNLEGRQERLDGLLSQLEMCEKALQDYLETKRVAFPRFYFVAPADLLDILSKGSNPQLILRHLPKCFDNVHNLEFRKDEAGDPSKGAIGMYSGTHSSLSACEGEYVAFAEECSCDGPVESWLQNVVDAMRAALSHEFKVAIPAYDEKPRTKWIFDYSVQNTIMVSRTFFTQDVNEAFEELEEGNEDALKGIFDKQVSQLADLITIINGELTKNDRKKLITLCTIDVHARDVVQRLIEERVENQSCFQWQSQLRYYQNEKSKEAQVNICDAEIKYTYEYIGNCGCLCITPLTDRCYITLTQAQRLVLGGAPAGPAGTGKTESTKDLARALGVQCYVFNCSDQMDYKAMGQIYKGLAQTGAWGCFDEFNRIPVAVLSVCSTQYKTVLDALRARKERFVFEDIEVTLRSTVMAFITMNPGYPGRAELPESLKALFRPVSMCVPDMALIVEIMLMSEGFNMSKMLSRKFVILYRLCEDLLSKSKHYDWKLRAIKTTLYVAGGMKRSAPDLSEDKVLLRALRDFNLGKLTADDTGIFMGLLNDLFPKTVELVPRAIDREFEPKIKEAALELGYQADETFCLKISQLREIFVVRWSVFLLGPAGCGKSAIWKTLMRAQQNFGEKTFFKPINPKAVTRNELYGYLHPSTREWKEGLMSVTYRDMSNNKTNKHQWIVLDGDIDAEWIESMNTVMDDNKMLTLASNERIPLTASMRLLLEINHMNHCSPATVSRGGVIYVNADDVGWKPAVDSWIEKLDVADLRPLLSALFSRYVDPTLEYCRRNFKYVVPIPAISQVMSICKILESILPQEAVRGAPPPDKKLLEHQFVFACVWAFGGCMLVDKVSDYRTQFSKSGGSGMVFDYYVDDASCSMVPWENKVPSFSYMPDNFSSLFVPTVDTTRLTYFLDTLIAKKHYVMFVGNTGTGKTAIMRDKLKNMDSETMAFSTINMNSFSDAPSLQGTLEQPLEKKSGVRFGPPGSKRLVYFVDDMNMPFVDKYDTQSAIELIRQSVDYRGWFDKVKIVLKEVTNTQYCACMNPTAGSFNITPRMQRHFVTFAVQMPHMDIVRSIYCSMVEGHLNQGNFDSEVIKLGSKLVDASIELHRHVMNNFLPSAVKFHYQFNLRELSNITQGLLRMTKDYYREPVKVVRLWVHECERVLADRMINDTDMTKFNEFRVTVTKKYFDDVNQAEVEARPLLYNNFMTVAADDTPIYNVVPGYEQLRKTLNDKLAEYNESNAVMDLVLFQQAMEHICRITRIISLPTGNAMLVGVGGSGKQSLARLASFICGYEVFQIAVSSSYGVADFKENLLALYTKAGVKGTAITFLMTDNQIVNEKFLVYINDLLSTGYIADLCTQEDKDTFCNSVRGEVKQAGMVDSADNCWDFFIDKVRKFLHVVLCFSPVGDKFRIRARQFPALVNCTAFDWFHTWPAEALVSVATRFLVDIPAIEADTRENIAYHMAFAHQSVAEASRMYLESVRRYNYTTPKSYLELISLYKDLLARKREELRLDKERLENGVTKIAQASAQEGAETTPMFHVPQQVADLQVNLKQEQIIVEEKKAKTGALIETIGQEKAVVDEAVEAGREDEEAAAKLQAEVTAFADECTRDLAAAEPVIKEAEAALNSLDKGSLGELKSFGSPAAEVVQVVSACIVLTAPGGKIPKDLSWNAGKKMMGNVDAFLKSLLAFDKDNVPVQCVEKCEKDYLSNPNFNPDYIRNKSGAAAGLCGWVVNICKYFRIYQVVAPKRAALAEANKRLDGANKKLTGIRAKVKELKDRVASLEDSLMKATEDKNNAIAQAEKTATKAKLADRLINGLSGENKRWNETIAKFGVAEGKLVGDVLLAAAFVSYAGPFNMEFRKRLVTEKWLPDITERQIPLTSGFMPLDMLADESAKAKWANEGLMTDPLSVENGAIMSNASRWSLMIDPQLQGIKWIMNRELPNGLKIIQQSQAKYIDTVISCIETGTPLLMENLPEDIDAVLDPVIGKQTIKRGRNLILKIGDNEVEYDQNFRLYLQTKLANPHYKPEIAAQTTLVNFCVTEVGLEEQLLAQVVDHERPDLQEQARSLVRQLGEYTITLKELEDNLLQRLANSQGDILEDIALIENLEETKRTAVDIAEKVKQAKETEVSIGKAREVYRTVATRGSLVYFLVDTLNALDRCYHYSMANFVYILRKGMDQTPGGKDESAVVEAQRLGEEVDVERRVQLLISFTTQVVFGYVAQGLFERHKLIVATQLCMAILKKNGELQQQKFDFLLRGPKVMGMENPLKEWVLDSVWGSVQALKASASQEPFGTMLCFAAETDLCALPQPELEDYAALPDDLVGSAKRWQEWMELERPEDEPLPGDWKRMPEFERLLIFRTLRPDRLTAAMQRFVANTIGKEFTSSQQFDLERSFQDSSPGTPIFVFLSPGVDVAASVEGLGKKLGFTADTGHYTAVSLGQGQEPIAMNNLTNAHKNGGWVLLQNIHLTIDWTSGPLEKKVDKLAEGAHKDFRLFLSAEPPPLLERALPISLLQNSIKLTNEPPEGLRANLRRAYGQYNEEMLEGCAKQAEYRSIIFALCYFHAALLERKKFGVGNLPAATSGIGWNMNYPFNTGDLLCCGQCASNYLENNVPWDDLRYIFGEIMYGGHIVEDWDRRLANAYLFKYFNETLLEGMEMFPAFFTPANTMTHKQVLEYIDEAMPPETPLAFGLHPNAEIGFKLREAERFCANVLCLQPREAGGEGGMSVEEKAKMVLDDLVERLPEQFDMEDIRGRVDEFTPYVMVAIQESDRMNGLLSTMKRSLAELDLGLKGDLTMSEPMEKLMLALANDGVPASWANMAYPSLRPLGSWLVNLLQRVSQLVEWTADLGVPKSVWLSGLFNPQSFLTAVMQTTARRNDWPLDKTVVLTEVTKKQPDQIDAPSRDGAFIHGLTLEGARWDEKAGTLDDSRPKELFCPMPVMLVRAVTVDKAEMKDAYQCPVYTTEARFRQEVFTAQLKSKHSWIKWTLAGVCLFLDVV
ncbi:MAG: flagellar outer dynein arm heavy chain beta [Trebouxia sp. A1-2]|nr:MAG: flagellar outer dynein arm heavy chain beta [Trebouxia sp. A1-2]